MNMNSSKKKESDLPLLQKTEKKICHCHKKIIIKVFRQVKQYYYLLVHLPYDSR
jgi:hypothetical protein